jgi:hypothetical protein
MEDIFGCGWWIKAFGVSNNTGKAVAVAFCNRKHCSSVLVLTNLDLGLPVLG